MTTKLCLSLKSSPSAEPVRVQFPDLAAFKINVFLGGAGFKDAYVTPTDWRPGEAELTGEAEVSCYPLDREEARIIAEAGLDVLTTVVVAGLTQYAGDAKVDKVLEAIAKRREAETLADGADTDIYLAMTKAGAGAQHQASVRQDFRQKDPEDDEVNMLSTAALGAWLEFLLGQAYLVSRDAAEKARDEWEANHHPQRDADLW